LPLGSSGSNTCTIFRGATPTQASDTPAWPVPLIPDHSSQSVLCWSGHTVLLES
jgi:hypothetical protein